MTKKPYQFDKALVLNIPLELTEREQWVAWSNRDGRKIPINARTKRPAKSNDPKTWADWDTALTSLNKTLIGPGFILSADDPYCGIDLDNCIVDEFIDEWAMQIVKRFASYTEISPSGRGLKILIRARKPADSGCKIKVKADWPGARTKDGVKSQIELYDHNRFWTITGEITQKTPIADRQAELDAFMAEHFGRPSPQLDTTNPPSLAAESIELDQSTPPSTPQADLDLAWNYLNATPRSVSGDRGHDKLWRAVCNMLIGFNLSEADARPLIERWNEDSDPPWSKKEIDHKFRQAKKERRLNPQDIGSLIGGSAVDDFTAVDSPATTAPDGLPPNRIAPQRRSAGQIADRSDDIRAPVVDGLFRRGDIANIIAAPKLGKSWLSMGLALAVAQGENWLKMPTQKSRVLIIDNEIHSSDWDKRLRTIAAKQNLKLSGLHDRVDVDNLRDGGRLVDLLAMRQYFRQLERGHYGLIILDAFYRFMPPKMSENDNGDMTRLYNLLTQYASMADAAIVLIHHTSKGSQSDKSTTDVGSGAGAMSRAADCHLTIRPHEIDGLAVVDAAVRTFKPVDPFSIQWDYPLWRHTEETPALKLAKTKNDTRQSRKDAEGIEAIIKVLRDAGEPVSEYEIRKQTGFGPDRRDRLLNLAVKADEIVEAAKCPTKIGTDQRFFRLPTADEMF